MTPLAPGDKMSLATFLEAATVDLAEAQAFLPLVQDDGLKRLVEAAISTGEFQVKGIQEFCHSHGLA